MIDEKWLFTRTERIELTLTRELIKNYALAIHEDNPIYFDQQAAIAAGYSDVVAPITMPIIFWQYIDVPWLKNIPVVIHGKQNFSYHEPLIANRTYHCDIQLTNLQNKERKDGSLMQVADHKLHVYFNDQVCGTFVSTLLIMEGEDDTFSK